MEGDIVSLESARAGRVPTATARSRCRWASVSEVAATLLEVTEESLYKAIAQAEAGARISDIGHAVQTHVEAHGFRVVREFVGHGSGSGCTRSRRSQLRRPGRGPRLAEGMVLAIEPMVNTGKPAVKVLRTAGRR